MGYVRGPGIMTDGAVVKPISAAEKPSKFLICHVSDFLLWQEGLRHRPCILGNVFGSISPYEQEQ
jgi:hypothetical protein